MRFNRYIPLVAAALFLYACSDKSEPESPAPAAPVLQGTDPAEGAVDISYGELRITLKFDQNVSCTRSGISLTPSGSISGVDAHDKALYIDVTGLNPDTRHTLTLPSGSVKGLLEGQEVPSAISISFTTKAEPAPPVDPPGHYTLDPVKAPCNPSVTAAARTVYDFLLQYYGRKIISGVQSGGTANNNDRLDKIAAITGKHPALGGYDFIFEQYSPTPSGWSWSVHYEDMSAPMEHWSKGGLVSYMWHWSVPTSKDEWEKGKNYPGNGYDFSGYSFYADKTAFDIREAVKEGTWQHEYALAEMDKVASYLKILSDAGVPVIWRPFHEAAGNTYSQWQSGAWFWWGRYGAEPCKALWKLMYDRFTLVHKLDNLIWVWTVDYVEGAESSASEWYPGDDCVDVVGTDIYAEDTDAKTAWYQFLVDVTKGRKLVAISECGNIPDPSKCLAAGEKWSWWMVWDDTYELNTETYWKTLMLSSSTFTRENMPSFK